MERCEKNMRNTGCICILLRVVLLSFGWDHSREAAKFSALPKRRVSCVIRANTNRLFSITEFWQLSSIIRQHRRCRSIIHSRALLPHGYTEKTSLLSFTRIVLRRFTGCIRNGVRFQWGRDNRIVYSTITTATRKVMLK